jgi:hypothetical protein
VQREIQAGFNEEYGRNGDFLDALEADPQCSLVEVPADTTVWVERPTRQTPDEHVGQVRQLAAGLPSSAWQGLKWREGAKGPLVFGFARLLSAAGGRLGQRLGRLAALQSWGRRVG